MAPNVVILAAGRGKRMRSERPKVLHLLAGKPLLAHVIATAQRLAAGQVCVVYGHGGDEVPRAVSDARVRFVKQEPQLGTGHALKQALRFLDAAEPTMVLYGDVPLVRPETIASLMTSEMPRVTVLTAELENPAGYGRIVRDEHGRFLRIVEDKDATPAERRLREVNTGIMVLPTPRLADWLSRLSNANAQGEYYLTDVVALAVAEGVAVEAAKGATEWETLGVNSCADLARLERLHQRERARVLMDQGVTLMDPARIDVRGDLECGTDARIDINCIFEGRVVLGSNVEIGAHCILRNVEVGAATRIEPYSHIDGARIGARCRIGPFARIRPGTELAVEVHIGNFVEVKASDIGEASKANHLAYVGDTTVGRNVNIGAGTITCNYDGANKHRTIIEDDVHIGSDVQLVAPVTVARGVTVGAGTTVWQDTSPGGLVVNPKSQAHRPEWKRPGKAGRSTE